MVGTQSSRRFRRWFTGDWLRLLIIVLFFVLVALVSTSPASGTSPPAATIGEQDASGRC